MRWNDLKNVQSLICRWKWWGVSVLDRSQQHKRMDVVHVQCVCWNVDRWFDSHIHIFRAVLLLDAKRFECRPFLSCNQISVCNWSSTATLLQIWWWFHFSLPWNQSTPTGFFVELCVTMEVGYEYIMVNGTPLLFFISMCIHHQAFYQMFQHLTNEAKLCDEKIICDLIRFQLSAKE